MAALNLVDGDFTTPQEVEGSGVISIDETTRARVLTRRYCVRRANYSPLLTSTVVLVYDSVFSTFVLVDEHPDSSPGQMYFFTRIYSEIPAARTEPLMIAFAMPGRSRTTISIYTQKPTNWQMYGNGNPYTRVVKGSVAYSYQAGNPNNLFAPIPAISQIILTTSAGSAPVDWAGDFCELAGVRSYAGNGVGVGPGVETAFNLVATTVPPTIPANWVQEVAITRWRGAIWQMAVTTIPTT